MILLPGLFLCVGGNKSKRKNEPKMGRVENMEWLKR